MSVQSDRDNSSSWRKHPLRTLHRIRKGALLAFSLNIPLRFVQYFRFFQLTDTFPE